MTILATRDAGYQCCVKLLQDGAPTVAFPMDTIQIEPPVTGRKAPVIAHTRARTAVEEQVLRQLLS